MRRRLVMYAGTQRLDMKDDNLVLMNYTIEDADSPTAVRNSYSQNIKLPGTPANNAVFGHMYRSDRRTVSGTATTGVSFNPSKKTPFSIYDDHGTLLQTGYLKLNSVSQGKDGIEYDVTLYGGLGSFLYSLTYDDNGDKRSLASIGLPDIGFTINASTVLAAWGRLAGHGSATKYDTVNFAPCYNGCITDNFSADKALVRCADIGLPESITEDETTYRSQGGFTLIDLNGSYTEQQTKDYRSYLQRPVLRMKSIIQQCCDPTQNGGYTVHLDTAFFNNVNPYYNRTWLTLPLLNTLTRKSISETFSLDVPYDQSLTGKWYGQFSAVSKPIGSSSVISLCVEPEVSTGYDTETLRLSKSGNVTSVLMVAVAYNAAGTQLGKSDIIALQSSVSGVTQPTVQALMAAATTTELRSGTAGMAYNGTFSGGTFSSDVAFELEGDDIAYIRIFTEYITTTGTWQGLWRSGGTAAPVNLYMYDQGGTQSTETVTGEGYVRSGVAVTAAELLASTKTPADYLLSFCKMFGLMFVCKDKDVWIYQRKTFYNGTIVPIEERIDRSATAKTVPMLFSKKWYEYVTDHKGEWPDYYASVYGRTFGSHRLNTGYSFNADTENATSGIIFKGVAQANELNKYNVNWTSDSKKIAPCLMDGGKFTLWNGTETLQKDVPGFGGTTVSLNAAYPGYDIMDRPQFHSSDNKAEEQEDVLLMFNGMVSDTKVTQWVSVTDDSMLMSALNEGSPCWLLGDADGRPTYGLPHFSRYYMDGAQVKSSLDFGTPSEVDIPGITFATDSSVFAKFWNKYMGDRYSTDARVLTVKVNLNGVKVDSEFMRSFFYFDRCIWAINRIINHSISTDGSTECEFVRVAATTNYTTT